MFATRARLSQFKTHRQLQAEILEDRNVLSAFGLMPTVTELVSAPVLPALVRTVADIVPAIQTSAIVAPVGAAPAQQLSGLLAVGQTAVEAAPLQLLSPLLAVPQVAVDAAPLQQVSDLLGGLIKDAEVSLSANVPVSSVVSATTVALGIVGVQVGLQTDVNSPNVSPTVPGPNTAVSVTGSDKIVVAATTSAASPAIEVSAASGAAGHPGAKAVIVTTGASGASVATIAPSSETASVVPLALRDVPNVLFVVPGTDLGQPVGNLQNAIAVGVPNDIRVVSLGEPFGPVAPDVSDGNDGIDRVPLSPQSAGMLNSTAPVDLAAIENALRNFLDQLDDLRQDLNAMLGNVGPTPWVLMTLAVAAAAGEIVRRRLRQGRSHDFVSETAKREALRFFPAFDNLKEES